MKTKQEQIAEMAVIGCVRNPQAHTTEECLRCDFKQGQCNAYRHAEKLYNAGYRKLPEGAVVLTKEECDNKVILNEDHFERALNYEREKARKGTAKEILNRINEYNLDYNWDLKEEFKKLCKDYGVEVEDD